MQLDPPGLSMRARDENPSGWGATTPRLRALSDLRPSWKQKCANHTNWGVPKQTQGIKTSYWKNLRPLVNKQATTAVWNKSKLSFYEKRYVMRYLNPTIINQQHTYRYGFSPNANCPICPCTDSALHILSGCQHTKMRNMIIKRHNTASVLIVQALQKGPCGANQIAYTDKA